MKKTLIIVVTFVLVLVIVSQSTYIDHTSEMTTFPSYDWDSADAEYLAAVAANTNGTDREKQEAVINVLAEVWDKKVPISEVAEPYIARNTDRKQPTEKDYELVDMVSMCQWAD